jgi:ABC-type sugar transport system ATPase subunit
MIRLENISWQADSFRLQDVSFTVPDGAYGVLMGRTGCGKTSLLEIICGLRRPTAGRLWIGDRDITAEAPGRRGIGYVPQDGALFPTMSKSPSPRAARTCRPHNATHGSANWPGSPVPPDC